MARSKVSSTGSDRSVRVFVSSTFADMKAERNYLAKFTFPELRKRCRERGVSFTEVDLRWGITDKQVEEGRILPICLEEIRNCRPFFIGILGNRYGTPARSFPPHLVSKYPWIAGLRGRSYTEIEMVHGVLNDPAMKNLALFCLREDEDSGGGNQPRSRNPSNRKLAYLKERIRKGGYRLAWYRNPRELGGYVLETLWAQIDARFPATSTGTSLERQANEHELFAESRAKVYIPRPDDFQRLDAHAASSDPPLVLLGESGVGKTALAANWALRRRASFPDDHVILHFIGTTPESSDAESLMLRIVSEIRRRWAFGMPIPEDLRELGNTFAEWLAKVPAKSRLVLVLDGLNQLDARSRAYALEWLPDRPPTNVRVVCSTLPGPTLETVRRKGWCEHVVEGLCRSDRARLIRRYLKEFRKTPESVFRDLARAPQSSNPLYLRAVLEEMRVSGDQETLEPLLRNYLEAKTVPDLYDRILARLEADYSPGRRYRDMVRDALSLLWASPRGLSQAEIRELVGNRENPVPAAFWSPFYVALQESLVSRSGYLTFFHDMLRQAVRNRYLASAEDEYNAHKRLAEYFECMFSQFGEKEGYRSLSLRCAEEALRCADETDHGLLAEGSLLVAGASVSQAVGVSPENARHFERAWKLARKASGYAERAGRNDLLADSFCLRSRIETHSNPDLGRLDLLDRAVALRKQTRDPEGLRDTLRDRAVAAMRKGDLSEVERPLHVAESAHRRIHNGKRLDLAHIRQVFGEYYYLRGWWSKAAQALEEARSMYRTCRYPGGVCAAEGWLGLALCRRNDEAAGWPLVRKALAFERINLGSVEGAAKWLHAAGVLFLDRGKLEQGLDALALAEELRLEQNHGELPKTIEAIAAAKKGFPVRYRTWCKGFDPRKTEFAPFAFLWGLGPFRRFAGNPIISARGTGWENRYVFNPAAWADSDGVRLWYRAQDSEGTSRIGLATSRDGIRFERESSPVLSPVESWEQGGGCEDPRVVRVENRFVMTYTAFDGKTARLAIAESRDGRRWTNRRLVFPNDGWTKSGAILPRRINGAYWMYFGDKQIRAACSKDLIRWDVIAEPVLSPRSGFFDSFLVEPGPPPIWLEEDKALNRPGGILLIYNGAEKTRTGLRYHIAQVLLDPNNPNCVLRRSVRPLLSPVTPTEKHGQVPNVVFANGLVRFKKRWYVYFGMGDEAVGIGQA